MDIKKLYDQVTNNEITKDKFLYEVRRNPVLGKFVTGLNNFKDTVQILKNKGYISEIKPMVEKKDDPNLWLKKFNKVKKLSESHVVDQAIDIMNFSGVDSNDYKRLADESNTPQELARNIIEYHDSLGEYVDEETMQMAKEFAELVFKLKAEENYDEFDNTEDEWDEWIDPSGGTHYGDEDDPAAMYKEGKYSMSDSQDILSAFDEAGLVDGVDYTMEFERGDDIPHTINPISSEAKAIVSSHNGQIEEGPDDDQWDDAEENPLPPNWNGEDEEEYSGEDYDYEDYIDYSDDDWGNMPDAGESDPMDTDYSIPDDYNDGEFWESKSSGGGAHWHEDMGGEAEIEDLGNVNEYINSLTDKSKYWKLKVGQKVKYAQFSGSEIPATVLGFEGDGRIACFKTPNGIVAVDALTNGDTIVETNQMTENSFEFNPDEFQSVKDFTSAQDVRNYMDYLSDEMENRMSPEERNNLEWDYENSHEYTDPYNDLAWKEFIARFGYPPSELMRGLSKTNEGEYYNKDSKEPKMFSKSQSKRFEKAVDKSRGVGKRKLKENKERELTKDDVSPILFKQGLEHELDACYTSITDVDISPEKIAKAEKKVLANLSKDLYYYHNKMSGQKISSFTYEELKDGNDVDKENQLVKAKKQPVAKSNVKDTLGKKEAGKKNGKVKIKIMKEPTTKMKKFSLKEMFDNTIEEADSKGKLISYMSSGDGWDTFEKEATFNYNDLLNRLNKSKNFDDFINQVDDETEFFEKLQYYDNDLFYKNKNWKEVIKYIIDLAASGKLVLMGDESSTNGLFKSTGKKNDEIIINKILAADRRAQRGDHIDQVEKHLKTIKSKLKLKKENTSEINTEAKAPGIYENIDMIQEAQDLLNEGLDLLIQGLKGTSMERQADAYIIAHLDNWINGGNPYDYTIPRILEELEEEDGEDANDYDDEDVREGITENNFKSITIEDLAKLGTKITYSTTDPTPLVNDFLKANNINASDLQTTTKFHLSNVARYGSSDSQRRELKALLGEILHTLGEMNSGVTEELDSSADVKNQEKRTKEELKKLYSLKMKNLSI